MNKAEKALVKKIKANLDSPNAVADFTRDENIILERWRMHNIINDAAFLDMTSLADDHKKFIQNLNYPFTYFGDQEIKKSWYRQFRESTAVTIIRDVITGFAFIVSLYITISKLFP